VNTSESKADEWGDLGDAFRRLTEEERGIKEKEHPKTAVLSAYWSRSDPTTISMEGEKDRRRALERDAWWAVGIHRHDARIIRADKTRLGFFCLFRSPEVTEQFQERFQTLAARAGKALGAAKGSNGLHFWLHALFKEMLKTRSRLAVGTDDKKSGFLPELCEASVVFCSRLETEALEQVSEQQTNRIGSNIDRLRKECGWSFDKLASETGIDKKLVHSHIRGKHKPNPNTLGVYAQAFNRKLHRPITALI
jgi:hypothetical protein